MRFDENFLDEIKARLRLSDVIGKTVKLRRQGREYVGLSPFTREKSPSFFVNDDKGFFHDFSSGKHGDLISFLQETEKLSFVEAVERLAGEAGLALPEPDPRAAEAEKKRQGLADWLELASSWFESELRRPKGQEARAYLERRGLPEADWKRFRLGFAPADRTALKDYLIAKGSKAPELIDAGLLIDPEDGAAPYDRFRNRIIFPITDVRGRVVSFGGRALDPNARAKYLNGPETGLFHKGRTLYGIPEARKLLASGADGDPLVVVEGYMDAIACHRAGIAAVAPLGTALTEEQIEQLWRLHAEPTLAFDSDAAGKRAAYASLDRALPLLKPGRSLRFSMVEGGKDADDVLREQGPAALRSQLAQTTPFVDRLFERERDAAEPLDTPERRTQLKVKLRKIAAAITDGDLAQAYKEELLGRYEALWPTSQPVYTVGGAARELGRRGGQARWASARLQGATEEGMREAARLRNAARPLAAALAEAAINDPSVIDDCLEQVSVVGFGDQSLEGLGRELAVLRMESDQIGVRSARDWLKLRGFDEAFLAKVGEDARRAGASAPFLEADVTRERVQALWRQAFELLMKLEAMERAVEEAARDMARDNDSRTLFSLKQERDALRRLVRSDWSRETEASAPRLH